MGHQLIDHLFDSFALNVTVRGMMYYREALKLQALLEKPENKGY